jgi:hypothetical protein
VKNDQTQQEPSPDAELTVSERSRLKKLERRNRELEMENSFLMRGVRRAGSLVINGRLDVSRSGYYGWRSRPESATSQRREELKLLIEKAFDMPDGTYGHRRIQDQLDRWGVTAGLGLVCRLVREVVLEPSSHGRRVVLRRPGERAFVKGDLPYPRGGPAGHHPLHRMTLLPN